MTNKITAKTSPVMLKYPLRRAAIANFSYWITPAMAEMLASTMNSFFIKLFLSRFNSHEILSFRDLVYFRCCSGTDDSDLRYTYRIVVIWPYARCTAI